MGNDLSAFRELFMMQPMPPPPEIKDPEAPCPARHFGGVPHSMKWKDDYAFCRFCDGVYVPPKK